MSWVILLFQFFIPFSNFLTLIFRSMNLIIIFVSSLVCKLSMLLGVDQTSVSLTIFSNPWPSSSCKPIFYRSEYSRIDSRIRVVQNAPRKDLSSKLDSLWFKFRTMFLSGEALFTSHMYLEVSLELGFQKLTATSQDCQQEKSYQLLQSNSFQSKRWQQSTE